MKLKKGIELPPKSGPDTKEGEGVGVVDWREVEEYLEARRRVMNVSLDKSGSHLRLDHNGHLTTTTTTTKVSRKLRKMLRNRWPHALLLLSLSLLLLVILFRWVALDLIIQQQIKQEVRLVEGSDTFKKWVDVPVPVFIKFRFFNITNFEDFEGGGKPSLNEIGPYTYQETRKKKVLAIDKEADTIRYRQHITYNFRRDLSAGPESDRPILVNVPFVSVAKISGEMTNLQLAHTFTDRTLRDRGERLFNRYTVKEYLFDGFPVQSYVNFLSNPMLQLIGHVTIPQSFKGSRFGFYKGRNGSDDGEFVVSSGSRVPEDFGRILSWEGKTRLDKWEGQCNLINGTDGSVFHPFVKKTDLLRFYTPELCRSLFLVYTGEVTVKGISGFRFQLPHPKRVFEHKEFCFCPPKPKECLKQGVFNLSPCRDNAPVSFSAPHFFQSWEGYERDVDGLRATKELHDTYVDIEPNTGLLLRASKRLQFNIQVEPHAGMQTFRNVRKVLLPFMWVEESAEIPDDIAEEVKAKLYAPVDTAQKVSMGALVASCICIFVAILGCLYNQLRRRERRAAADREDRESRSSSAGVMSILSSVSRSPSLVSRGTNTPWSENKGTMTERHSESDSGNETSRDADSAHVQNETIAQAAHPKSIEIQTQTNEPVN